MAKCALCLENDADKKGSHLIPSFLLKMVENVGDSTARDRGLGFRLTADDVQIHFERSVPVEKVEEMMGELSDEQARSYPSPNIRDYIICSACESFLSRVESEYSVSLRKSEKGLYISTDKSLNATLLWISIFWRGSIADTYGFKLTKEKEECCRCSLVKYRDASDFSDVEVSEELKSVSYKIVRSPGYAAKKSGVTVFGPHDRTPYCFLTGEIAAFLYFSEVEKDAVPDDFFGFEDLLPGAEINNFEKGESVLGVDEEVFLVAGQKIAQIFASMKRDYIEGLIVGTATLMFGLEKLPSKTVERILQRITSDETLMGYRYTNEKMIEIISEEIKNDYSEE